MAGVTFMIICEIITQQENTITCPVWCISKFEGSLPTLCFDMLVCMLGSKDTQTSLGCFIVSVNQFTVGVKDNQK